MNRPALARVALATAAASLLAGTGVAAARTPATLRLDGIGPLKLGMSRSAALATGWLGHRGTGCPLGGPPLPVTYRFSGPRAAKGIHGSAEFNGDKLTGMSFSGGVRTVAGVTVGHTTATRMVQRYSSLGFEASSQFVDTFAGTFVTVKRGDRRVLGAFAPHKVITQLALPEVPVCE